jgi:hypothetical protein
VDYAIIQAQSPKKKRGQARIKSESGPSLNAKKANKALQPLPQDARLKGGVMR